MRKLIIFLIICQVVLFFYGIYLLSIGNLWSGFYHVILNTFFFYLNILNLKKYKQ